MFHIFWNHLGDEPSRHLVITEFMQIGQVWKKDIKFIVNFLHTHQHEKMCIVFYGYALKSNVSITEAHHILATLQKLETKCKIVFVLNDFWDHFPKHSCLLRKLLTQRTHVSICCAQNLAQLSVLHNMHFPLDTLVRFQNFWSCYEFVPFNNNPQNHVCVSGALHPQYYPERVQVRAMKGVVQLPYLKRKTDHYCQRLNNFLCCFASSVTVKIRSTNRWENTHLLLLKYFEILASGALLLCPSSEMSELKSLGLVPLRHYIGSPMVDMQQTIDYILNPIHREEIDLIRSQGQEYARTHLSSQARFKPFKEIFSSLVQNTNYLIPAET